MAREILLSASAMFLAIVLPQVLLLFIWKVQLVKVFEIFSFANAQHRFFEILAALIPLVILEAIIGVIFMMDYDRIASKLSNQFGLCLVVPIIGLNLMSFLFVGAALNYKEETIPDVEYYLMCGMIFLSAAMLLIADGFIAASRAESRHRKRRPSGSTPARRKGVPTSVATS
jgi:hypothetical protein